MRCRLAASTDSATVRREAVGAMAADTVEPRCSSPLMADSIAGCARRAAAKGSSASRSRSALERYPFVGSTLRSSSASSLMRLSGL